MTSCHQYTLTLRGLVDWTLVVLEDLEVSCLARHEHHHWASGEQNLWITLIKRSHHFVPFGSFEVHSSDIYTILQMFNGWIIIFLVYNFVIVVQKINSNSISSSIILLGTSQETLSEEESSDPENLWKSNIDPLCEPLESTKKIFHVSSESLQGWE